MDTKITKSNVMASIKDDKAHMDYLKQDVNYDQKKEVKTKILIKQLMRHTSQN